MRIGNFKKMDDGKFVGNLTMFGFHQEGVYIVAVDQNEAGTGPTHRMMKSSCDLAPGWPRAGSGKEDDVYFRIDSPILPGPFTAVFRRFENDSYGLIWVRPQAKSEEPGLAVTQSAAS